MRHVLLLSTLFLAGLPVAAQAQLPPVPEPTLTTPTLPLPLPPLPTVPAPTVPAPTVPVPVAPTPPSVPGVPAPAPASPEPAAPAATPGSPSSAGGGGARSTAPGKRAQRSETAPRRRQTVTFTFRVNSAGLVRIELTQIAPVCRDAGRLLFRADRGPNRFRFDGRPGRRPLRDGTYVAKTPSAEVRFAIVNGKPTRKRGLLAPSVCPAPEPLSDGLRSSLAPAGPGPISTPPPPRSDERDDRAEEGVGRLPRVLGTSLTEAAEAAASLHPAFYLLLALAITALGAATLPARTLPAASAGAALARRRAELTLGGTLALLTVIVAYWVTLL